MSKKEEAWDALQLLCSGVGDEDGFNMILGYKKELCPDDLAGAAIDVATLYKNGYYEDPQNNRLEDFLEYPSHSSLLNLSITQ